MNTIRFLIVQLLGGFTFALVAAAIIEWFCFTAYFPSCSGSAFQPFVLLIFGVGGVVISLLSSGIHRGVKGASWYRSWYILVIFVAVGVLAPKIYLILTGSDFDFSNPFAIMDVVFGAASFFAGVSVFSVGALTLRSSGTARINPRAAP